MREAVIQIFQGGPSLFGENLLFVEIFESIEELIDSINYAIQYNNYEPCEIQIDIIEGEFTENEKKLLVDMGYNIYIN